MQDDIGPPVEQAGDMTWLDTAWATGLTGAAAAGEADDSTGASV